MKLPVLGEAFYGADLLAVARRREGQARADKPSVDGHAARAAHADAAAFLSARQTEIIAQRVKEQTIGFYLDLVILSVDL